MKNIQNYKIVVYWIIFILTFSTLMSWFYTIEPWQVWFEKTFGKIDWDIKSEGLYFKFPFITQAIKMNTRNIVVTMTEWAATKDVQIVTTELAVNFSISPSSSIELYQTVWTEKDIEDRIVNKAVQESIKAATAKFTATEIITQREEVRQVMVDSLESKLLKRGLIINQLDITNVDFSEQFNNAIEAKTTAEQDALKAKALVEKTKFEAESKIAKAEWDAKAIKIAAEAEAEAIRIKAEAIESQGGKDYIQLKWIEQWNWVLPTTSLWTDTSAFINLK